MKLPGMLVTLVLVAGSLTSAFAANVVTKDTIIGKAHSVVAPEQRSKMIEARKAFLLCHPEKLAQLHKQYAEMHHGAYASGLGAKVAFMHKARMQQWCAKHQCPYQTPSTTSGTLDAKTMHLMKCRSMH